MAIPCDLTRSSQYRMKSGHVLINALIVHVDLSRFRFSDLPGLWVNS